MGQTVTLTIRETQVIELMAAGKTDRDIAKELRFSVRTANFHVGNILYKLRCRNRVEAANIWYKARREGRI